MNPRIGPYTIEDEIGSGGTARVFRARSPAGEVVALKLVTKLRVRDGVARFRREQRLQGTLAEADGFVPLLDAGDSPEGPYLVMPLVGGGTLRDRLDRGPLALEDALALGVKLARAAGRAHERGIVHRDLKPENVLFTEGANGGEPLIADLGLAKHFDAQAPGASQSVAVSSAGTLRGTVRYMAPEQAVDSSSATPAADVFALGAIVWECLAGRPVFAGENALDVLVQVSQARVPPLRTFCPGSSPLGRGRAREGARARSGRALAGRARARGGSRAESSGAHSARRDRPRCRRGARPRRPGRPRPRARPRGERPSGRGRGSRLGSRGRARPPPRARARGPRPSPGPRAEVGARPADARSRPEPGARRPGSPPRDGRGARVLPDEPDALAFRALLAYRSAATALARTFADRALAHDPRQPLALRVRGQLRVDHGHTELLEWQIALSELSRAVSLDAASAPAWSGLAVALTRAKRLDGALAASTVALWLDPTDTQEWVNDSQYTLAAGDAKRSRADVDRALELDPKNPRAWGLRSSLECDDGDVAGAVADADHALELDPRDPAALATHGVLHFRKGDMRAALVWLDRVIDVDPHSRFARGLRCEARFRLGDTAGARSDSDEFLVVGADVVETWTIRAHLLESVSDLPGAIEALDHAIALEETSAELHRWRGTLRANRRWGDGRDDLERVVALDERDVAGWNLLAHARDCVDDFEGALAAADQMLRLVQRQPLAIARRGLILAHLGRRPESEEAFTKAVALAPRDAGVLALRGDARACLGDVEGGLSDLEDAIALVPHMAEGLVARAEAHYRHAERARAVSDTEMLVREFGGCADAFALLAYYRLENDQTAECELALERAFALDPGTGHGHAARGLLRAARGDRTGALADFDVAWPYLSPRTPIGRAVRQTREALRSSSK